MIFIGLSIHMCRINYFNSYTSENCSVHDKGDWGVGEGRYYLSGARMLVVLYRPYFCVREGVSQCLGYEKAISVPFALLKYKRLMLHELKKNNVTLIITDLLHSTGATREASGRA